MEVVELGGGDDAAHEGVALEMFPGAEAHWVHAVFPGLIWLGYGKMMCM